MYAVWTLATLAVAGYGLAERGLAADARQPRLQRARDRGHDRVGDGQAAPRPPRLLGRVSSLDWLISIGLLPLSFALTGPVSAVARRARRRSSPPASLGAVVTLAALFVPGMRSIEGRAPDREPGPGLGAPEVARAVP